MNVNFKNRKLQTPYRGGFKSIDLAIRLVNEGTKVAAGDSILSEYGGNLKNPEVVRDEVKIKYLDVRESNKHYSLLQFIKYMKQGASFEFEIIPFTEERKKIDISVFYSSYDLFKSETVSESSNGLEEEIEKTIEYFEDKKKIISNDSPE